MDPDIVDELVLVVGEFVLEVVVVLGDSVVTIMEVNSIVVNSKSLPRILYRSLWIGRNISAREKFRMGKCHRAKMFLLPNTSTRIRHWLAMGIRRTILLQTWPNETHDAGHPSSRHGHCRCNEQQASIDNIGNVHNVTPLQGFVEPTDQR